MSVPFIIFLDEPLRQGPIRYGAVSYWLIKFSLGVHTSLSVSLCVYACVCLSVWLVFLTHGQTKRSARRGRTPLKRIWSRCFVGLSLTSFHQLLTSSFPSSFLLMDAEWFVLFLWKTRESNPGCWHGGDGSGDSLCCWPELYLIGYVCLCLPYVLFVSLSLAVFLSIS